VCRPKRRVEYIENASTNEAVPIIVLSCVISSISETFHSKCQALLLPKTLYKVQYFQTYCTCFDKAGYGEEEVVSSDGCDVPWNLVISSRVKECQPCLVAAMFADITRILFQKPFAL
jgi:hypothetical protein